MRAVVVTSDPDSLADVRRAWATDGIQTDVCTGVETAYRVLSHDPGDLVVLDDTLPRNEAVRLYTTVRTRENATSLPIIYRCPAIVSPDWAVRDYYVPPAADSGTLIMLGQAVLGPGSHGNGASNGHRAAAHRVALPAPPDRAGPSRSVTTVPIPPLAPPRPRRETWRDHVRAARGRRAARAEAGTTTEARLGAPRRLRPATGTGVSLLPFLLRWSWVILIAMAIGVAGAYGYLQSGRLPYQSTALLMLRPNYDYAGEALVTSNPARIASSAMALAGQADAPSVYEAASRALHGQLDISGDEIGQLVLAGRITITPVRSSSFIEVKASDPDPERAWLLADGYTRGLLADLTTQTQLVAAQQQHELQIRMGILQRQLAAVPSTANNARLGGLFDPAQNRVLQDMIDTETRLQALAQPQLPLMRYGETASPMQDTNVRRILIAGAAAGALCGLVVAYLLELLRQRLSKKKSRRGGALCR
jgi:hypothetical protein